MSDEEDIAVRLETASRILGYNRVLLLDAALEITRLRWAVKEIYKIAQHGYGCSVHVPSTTVTGHHPCDCGLDKLVKKVVMV